MKAMIFAAGLGSRFKPLTDTMPKALVPVLGKPLLEHVIEKLKANGFDEIIINIHHFGDQIIQFLESKDNFGIRIETSDERAKLLDTGGAIKKASWFFDNDESILIHNTDIFSDVDISHVFETHLKNKVMATLVVNNRDTSRYLFFDKSNNLKGWINEKNGEVKSSSDFNPLKHKKLAFFGIHVLSGEAIQYMKEFGDKFSIINFYLSICNKTDVRAYLADDSSMVDVGRLESLKKAEEFIKTQHE
ncbi:MAG: sugar phosphate nucleotidyltransferase [Dysgonamonadaceae bacterium]|nr:sugar phosphate nucleotidyltransferase [Dysgonamonadaceae bacterium]MDD4727377.1 sugar phosphate nucleotidyltransferase [Dysgonamonadaceae bacterium]